MPVSVSNLTLSSAIRDSLTSTATTSDEYNNLNSQIEASSKHILLTKIEYEEINNFKSSQESLKSKYIVLKPKNNLIKTTLTEKDNKPNGNGEIGEKSQSPKDARIPPPKRILFSRENVQLGWKSSGRKWKVGSGMQNVGNTCYLNSTLQALFHVPAVANWLIADAQHKDKCQSSDGCIICVMIDTLIDSQKNDGPIKPWMVYSRLRVICRHLVPGRQEDAHEFLRYLVEAMEKSYLLRFKNSKEFDQYSKETTPLNQILGGYLRSAVKCLACNHISTTFQHFEDILLDIRKSNTIEEALDGYFARERLEDMGYKCESCKKKVSATKQFYLERAPPVLCIQLKRFSVVGGKLNKHVVIRTKLDLSPYAFKKINETLSYRLVSMVTHLGASQHCGHYTAIGLTDVGGYYQFDDSSVRPISVQNVLNTNAYIMFYELEDTLPPSYPTKESTITANNGLNNSSSSTITTYNRDFPSSTNFNQSRNSNIAIINKTESNSGFIGPQLPIRILTTSSPSKLVVTTNGDADGKKLLILNDVNKKNNLSNNNNNNNSVITNGKIGNDTINMTSKLVNNSTNNLGNIQNSLIVSNKTTPNTHNNIILPTSNNVPQINGINKNSGKLIKNNNNNGCTSKTNNSSIHTNGNVKKWMPITNSNLQTESSESFDKNLLPSMPKLMEENISINQINDKLTMPHKNQNGVVDNEHKDISNNINILQNGHAKFENGFVNKPKSLVPYDANDDSDDDSSDNETNVVETKTGPWHVSQEIIPSPSLQGKTCFIKKKNNNFVNNNNNNNIKQKKNFNKNENTNNIVNQLLEIGQKVTNIATWNGMPNVEKVISENKREERKRKYDEENENEMDRGRVKKIKIQGPNNGRDNPGYNPFQETQLQQNQQNRRWGNGRFYSHQIYKRNHHRNQNFQQRHRNYLGFNNNNNHRGNHFNRRES